MLGKNTITINQATMHEALQEYFDRRYSPGSAEAGKRRVGKVNAVTYQSSLSSPRITPQSFDVEYEVTVEDVPVVEARDCP